MGMNEDNDGNRGHMNEQDKSGIKVSNSFLVWNIYSSYLSICSGDFVGVYSLFLLVRLIQMLVDHLDLSCSFLVV